MSPLAPAPSTMVVFSLVQEMLLGGAEVVEGRAFSRVRPTSSEITVAAGQDRDVLEHGLAAVAEAGRLGGGDP